MIFVAVRVYFWDKMKYNYEYLSAGEEKGRNMRIGWVDYSREERNKIVNILRLLGTQGTIDELGIGSVRDAFSDYLFPGISVLQTRAKYFVLIPYLFEKACEESAAGRLRSGRDVRNYIEKQEDRLVDSLIRNAGNEEDRTGIIGSRNYLSGRSVKMKPSAIYWNGLRTSSILLHRELSLDMACAAVYRRGRLQAGTERRNETEDSGADDWDAGRDGHLIFAPLHADYDFLKEARIGLRPKEAAYIAHYFEESPGTRNSAMAYMLKHPELIEKYESFADFEPEDFPAELSALVGLAQEFANFIYGAHLLYNIVFADGCGIEDETVRAVKDSFAEYCENYKSPNIDAIRSLTKCSPSTERFFREFDADIREKRIEEAKEQVVAREAAVKGSRRKLLRPEEYRFDSPVHNFKLSYRYDTARQIMRDIIEGMEE